MQNLPQSSLKIQKMVAELAAEPHSNRNRGSGVKRDRACGDYLTFATPSSHGDQCPHRQPLQLQPLPATSCRLSGCVSRMQIASGNIVELIQAHRCTMMTLGGGFDNSDVDFSSLDPNDLTRKRQRIGEYTLGNCIRLAEAGLGSDGPMLSAAQHSAAMAGSDL